MSNNLQSMALSVPHSGSIEGYIQAVSSIDMLSAEEERELAVRLREDEDLQAARKL
ncbi:MAG: sigma-70 factor domain-containing protein, partial [Pseudomonadota bacterium]|nr:sigma-70 factor domain-containing protein [Pseudomonadota bacterium]